MILKLLMKLLLKQGIHLLNEIVLQLEFRLLLTYPAPFFFICGLTPALSRRVYEVGSTLLLGFYPLC